MDRIQLKTDAKLSMRMANPHPVLVTLIYWIIIFAVYMVVSLFSSFLSVFSALFSDSAVGGLYAFGLFFPLLLISLIFSAVFSLLQIGYTGYTLRVINRQPAGISDLFAYARFFLKAWGLCIMIGIFVFLWSLLFVIPGIVASYRYCQAAYILAENPEKGIMECINESKAMMFGHKMDRFILDLSFIPWYLLSSITCGIASIYVTPYQSLTNAAYYNSLKYGNNWYGGYQQSFDGNYQQNGYQQGFNGNYQQNGYQQGFNGSYQQNGYQQGFNGNYQQNGYQQGFNDSYQPNGFQQGFDGSYQQSSYQQGFGGSQPNGDQPNSYQQDFNGSSQQSNGSQQEPDNSQQVNRDSQDSDIIG